MLLVLGLLPGNVDTNAILYNPATDMYYAFFTEPVNTARRAYFSIVDPDTGVAQPEIQLALNSGIRTANVEGAHYAITESGRLVMARFVNNGGAPAGVTGIIVADSYSLVDGSFIETFVDLSNASIFFNEGIAWFDGELIAGMNTAENLRVFDLAGNTIQDGDTNLINGSFLRTFVDIATEIQEDFYHRVTTRNCLTDEITVEYFDSNGAIVDATALNLIPCDIVGDVEQQVLCDDNETFIRHYVYSENQQFYCHNI